MSFVETNGLCTVSKAQSPAASKQESASGLRPWLLKFQLSTCSLPA
jgi:hypothetical protein